MATSKDYIAYLEDCLRHIPRVRFRAMFGEYALYCDDRVVGLVCDQTPFVKITEGTRKLLEGAAETGPPYKGAKDAYVLTEKELEDKAFIAKVITACRNDVPSGPKKKKKARRA